MPSTAMALVADLAALVRIPSITGSRGGGRRRPGGATGGGRDGGRDASPDPAAIRADPAWPGEETPRTSLPVVIGRLGRSGGRRVDPVRPCRRRAAGRPGDLDRRSVERPRSATARLYGRGACDMKGGVAAILAAVRALVASGAAERSTGELVVALVPGEEDGGQGTLAAIRAGVTGDLAIITGALEPRHRRRPRGRDHVPADRARPRRPRLASGARASPPSTTCTRSCARSRPTRPRRNAAETDPLMTALGLPYPTIVGIVSGGEWASTVLDRVVADGRYGVRLGQTPADAAADLRRGDRRGQRGRSVPPRPPGDRRDRRRPVRRRAASRRTTRCRSGWPTTPRR